MKARCFGCLLLSILLPICEGWVTYSSDEPILVDKNFAETKTFLFHFCLPINGLKDQGDIYFHIFSDTNINFIGIDFDMSKEGLDYVADEVTTPEFSIPLVKKYKNEFTIDPQTQNMIEGTIISVTKIKEVSIIIHSDIDSEPAVECKFYNKNMYIIFNILNVFIKYVVPKIVQSLMIVVFVVVIIHLVNILLIVLENQLWLLVFILLVYILKFQSFTKDK